MVRGDGVILRKAISVGFILLLVFVGSLHAVPPARAATLFRFKGQVTDLIGRRLGGATVTDTTENTWTTTAADGTYTLPASKLGSHRLHADRGLELEGRYMAPVVVAPVDTTVNFTVPYKSDGGFEVSGGSYDNPPDPSSIVVTTAASAVSRSFTFTTYAPNPGTPGQGGGAHCVYTTDVRTGQTQPATFVSTNGNGLSTWATTLQLPQGTPEGYYDYRSMAKDCSSGAMLTSRYGLEQSESPEPDLDHYSVDNTAPTLSGMTPVDVSNTNQQSQQLSVKVSDPQTGGRTGVVVSSMTFELRDLSAGTTSSFTVQTNPNLYYSGQVAMTTPVTLIVGHRYTLSFSVADPAGNVATAQQQTGFSVVRIEQSFPGAVAKVAPSQAVSMTTSGATRTFTFQSVPVTVSGSTAAITGRPQHPGIGFLMQSIDVTKAKIHLFNNNLELPGSPFNAPAAWGVRPSYAQMVTTDTAAASQQIAIAPIELKIPSLTYSTTLPANRAIVELSTPAVFSVPTCANPNGSCNSTEYPTTDPFPYHISSADAGTLNEHWRKATVETTTGLGITSACVSASGINPCGLAEITNYPLGLLYFVDFVQGKWKFASALCSSRPICTQQNAEAATEFHTVSDQDTAGNIRTYCVDNNSNIQDSGKCYQLLRVWVVESDPKADYTGDSLDTCAIYPGLRACTSKDFHVFDGGFYATRGFLDAGDAKDELILAADTINNANDPHTFNDWALDGAPYAERSYAVDRYDQYGSGLGEWRCDAVQGFYYSTSGLNGEADISASLGNYSGVKHKNLPQTTWRGYGDGACYGWDRLWDGHLLALMSSKTTYNASHESQLVSVYGHYKYHDSFVFSCGPGIPSPYAGCGWSVESDPNKVWDAGHSWFFDW
jgi:hypothetical protein